MDYAFVLGNTEPERNLKTYFLRQPNTVLVDNPALINVAQFINHLNTDASIVRPIGNIIIVSHGNDGGYMSIPFGIIILTLDRGLEVHTYYEVLEYADTHNLADILPVNINADTQIHIKGCKIGQSHAVPFVQKLKACFGDVVQLSAPKHFDGVYPLTDVGILETMMYDFSFPKLTAFTGGTKRDLLIAAFQAENFTFINGTPVPTTLWTTWLPRDVSLGNRNISMRINFDPPLLKNDGTSLTSHRMGINGGFRAETQTYTLTKPYSTTEAPTDRAQQEAVLRAALLTLPKFATTHPYPQWQRFELDSFEDFIDGFRWTFSRSRDRKNLICNGTRVLYTLVIPITSDPLGANNLLLNISPEPSNTSPSVPQILETNADLFLTV